MYDFVQRAARLGVVVALVAAGCSTGTEATTTTNAPPATSSTTTSTTTTTTSTTTSTTTTTTSAPVPQADAMTLMSQVVATVEADLFFTVDGVDSGLDYFAAENQDLECHVPGSYSIGTAAGQAGASAEDNATAGIRLKSDPALWNITIAEVETGGLAIDTVAAFAEFPDTCPEGVEQVPVTGPDGSQATDGDGNPIFVEAQIATVPLETQITGHSAASVMSLQFVGASGDTTIYRGAFARGPFLVYVEGQDSEVTFRRLLKAIDAALRSAS